MTTWTVKNYRDVIIFTFLMVNVLYIVMVTMLQVQANLALPWLMFSWTDVNGMDGIVFNITYVKPDSEDLLPEIKIGRETDKLDMLGLFFLLTFSTITGAQMVGMLFHRWQTCKLSQTN